MIEILRLKNGEDIIGEVLSSTEEYEITEPMAVEIEFRGKESGLVMRQWLPVQLIDTNKTSIKKEDVLTKFKPNKDFEEYYTNTVNRVNELLTAKKLAAEMTDEEIQEAIDMMELGFGNNTIH